jgi:hypothetical protein
MANGSSGLSAQATSGACGRGELFVRDPADRGGEGMGPGSMIVARRRARGFEGDRLRRYRIVVDGVTVGSLRQDEELEVSVAPGRHEVVARIDWSGSEPLHVVVEQGQTLRVLAEPAAHAGNPWKHIFARNGWLTLRLLD